MHLSARIEQDIDEFRGGQKVRLIDRNDVATRIALGRITKMAIEIGLRAATAAGGASGINDFRCDSPVVVIAALNGAVAHQPDVVEELLAVASRIVEDGFVGSDGILERLLEMPGLRCDWREVIGLRKLQIGAVGNLHRRWASDGLGQETDHVVEIARRAQAAVEPGRIASAGANGRAWLTFDQKPLHHRSADRIDSIDYERIEVVIERIAKRRTK